MQQQVLWLYSFYSNTLEPLNESKEFNHENMQIFSFYRIRILDLFVVTKNLPNRNTYLLPLITSLEGVYANM